MTEIKDFRLCRANGPGCQNQNHCIATQQVLNDINYIQTNFPPNSIELELQKLQLGYLQRCADLGCQDTQTSIENLKKFTKESSGFQLE